MKLHGINAFKLSIGESAHGVLQVISDLSPKILRKEIEHCYKFSNLTLEVTKYDLHHSISLDFFFCNFINNNLIVPDHCLEIINNEIYVVDPTWTLETVARLKVWSALPLPLKWPSYLLDRINSEHRFYLTAIDFYQDYVTYVQKHTFDASGKILREPAELKVS